MLKEEVIHHAQQCQECELRPTKSLSEIVRCFYSSLLQSLPSQQVLIASLQPFFPCGNGSMSSIRHISAVSWSAFDGLPLIRGTEAICSTISSLKLIELKKNIFTACAHGAWLCLMNYDQKWKKGDTESKRWSLQRYNGIEPNTRERVDYFSLGDC